MKIKSIIETTDRRYAVLEDTDTIFNKMNEPYFFAEAESNNFYRNLNGYPEYIIGHMPVIFNTSKINLVYPISRDISGVEE